MKRLLNTLSVLLIVLAATFNTQQLWSQTCGNDCIACIEGGPCCTVFNACNAYSTYCYDCDTYYGTTDVGCDLSCAPIDSGILFLLIGGLLFGINLIKRSTPVHLVNAEA